MEAFNKPGIHPYRFDRRAAAMSKENSEKNSDAEVAAILAALDTESNAAESAGSAKPASAGLVAARTALGIAAVGSALLLPFFIVPWLPRKVFGALPWLPTSPRRVNAVLDALRPQLVKPGCTFVDLGAGDGVAVIEAAKRGMVARGVELNPSLVLLSHINALRAGFQVYRRCSFRWGDLFKHPVADADVIMVFGVVPLMPRIASKLDAEAKPGTVVMSHKFALPADSWGPHQRANINDVLVYCKGESPLR